MNKNDNASCNIGPMLNAYPDSMGGRLGDTVAVLKKDELQNVFRSFYILPSIYNTDLDRGFSVIDYNLNRELADAGDLDALEGLNIDLKLDFILNHASVLSPQFRDLVKNGEKSKYADFFINWNKRDHMINDSDYTPMIFKTSTSGTAQSCFSSSKVFWIDLLISNSIR